MPDDDIEEMKFEKREGLEKDTHDIDKIARDVRETEYYHPKKASFVEKAKKRIANIKEKYNQYSTEQRLKKKANLEKKLEKAKEKEEIASLENKALMAEKRARNLEAQNKASRGNPLSAIGGIFGGRKGPSRYEQKYSQGPNLLSGGASSSKNRFGGKSAGALNLANSGNGSTMGRLLASSGSKHGLSLSGGPGSSKLGSLIGKGNKGGLKL